MDKHENIPPELLKEIERFVLHKMLPEERESFKARMSINPDMMKATEEMLLFSTGIQEVSLEEKLNYFHKDLSKTSHSVKATTKVFRLKRWLVAASIIFVILVATALLFFTKGKEERLFAEYYQRDPGLLTAMGASENYSFERAMIDYKVGNYEAAITGWERLQLAKPDNDTLHFFLGSAWLALKQTRKAIPYFKKVTAFSKSAFISDAYWYLALAQLKEGNRKESLRMLTKTDHPKRAALLLLLQDERQH
ncbi:MAG TPA: hypothetical protein VF610_03115 [Segetibacter sp.]